jgi:hypothetical protein
MLGSVTALVVIYYSLPLDHPFGWGPVLALLGGLVLVALLTAWQVRSVLRSPHPGRRAAETLALTVSLILVLFAAGYQALAAADQAVFSEPLTRTDTLYFVVTVFATVGFGDISPVSDAARVLATVQMIADVVLIGLVVKAMLSAAERGRAGRASDARSSTDDPVRCLDVHGNLIGEAGLVDCDQAGLAFVERIAQVLQVASRHPPLA